MAYPQKQSRYKLARAKKFDFLSRHVMYKSMADDIKQIIKETAKETAKEVRHEFDLVIEDLEKGTLKAIREELTTHGQQLKQMDGRLQRVEKDLTEVKDDVAVIKTTLGGTESENPLMQRVEELEAKAR